jgi:hypothetical protein
LEALGTKWMHSFLLKVSVTNLIRLDFRNWQRMGIHIYTSMLQIPSALILK